MQLQSFKRFTQTQKSQLLLFQDKGFNLQNPCQISILISNEFKQID